MTFRDEGEAHQVAADQDRARRVRHEEEARIARLMELERAEREAFERGPQPRQGAWWEVPLLLAGGLVMVFALLAQDC